MSNTKDDPKILEEPHAWNLTFDQVTSFFTEKGVTPKCIVCGSSTPKIHSEDESSDTAVSIVAWRKVEAVSDHAGGYAMRAAEKYLPGVAVECGSCGNIQIFSHGTILAWVKNKNIESPKNGE